MYVSDMYRIHVPYLCLICTLYVPYVGTFYIYISDAIYVSEMYRIHVPYVCFICALYVLYMCHYVCFVSALYVSHTGGGR
jgi:hypothetical protein